MAPKWNVKQSSDTNDKQRSSVLMAPKWNVKQIPQIVHLVCSSVLMAPKWNVKYHAQQEKQAVSQY